MDDLGIDDSDTASALNESLALKAFLRLKREERRRHVSSTVSISEKPSTPSYRERSHDYNVSYDPTSYLEISNIDGPPETPMIGFSPRKEVDFDEEQKYTSLYLDDRGNTSAGVNTSFSSMHAIINTSFQEKIDYQRKLREQQSELTALRDKIQLLRTENTRLTVAAVKSKQKQLPVILRNLMRKRRQNKMRRALRKWFELCYDKNVGMVRESEEYWGREHALWQERERMLARLVKRSVALNMRFVLRRSGLRQIRRAFTLWVAYSSQHGPHLDSMAVFVSRAVNRNRTRRLLRVWHIKFKFKLILLRMMKRFNALSDKQNKTRAMQAWKRSAVIDRNRKQLYYFLVRMIRNTMAYRLFQKWKHFAFVLYPLKARILKALVSRGMQMQTDQKRHAFREWRIFSGRVANKQHIFAKVIVRMKSRSKYLAFHKWQAVMSQWRHSSFVITRMTHLYARQMDLGRRSAFVRWQITVKEMQRAEQHSQLVLTYQELEVGKQKFKRALSQLQRETEVYKHRMAASTRLVFRAMKSLSLHKCKTTLLTVALHRWKWRVTTEYNIQIANRQSHMRHVRSVLNKTFLHKQSVAFEKWKFQVKEYHRGRRIVIRILRSSSRKSVRSAFHMWVTFSVNYSRESAETKLAFYRVRNVLESWRQASILHAWRKWKQFDSFVMRTVFAMKGCLRIFHRVKVRTALSIWRNRTIFTELRATRRQLLRSESASQNRLKVAFLGIMKRGTQKYFVLWQEYVRQTISVKKTILLVLQRNLRARLHHGFVSWKDQVMKCKFLSSGCRAVRRVFTRKIGSALLRAFRLWVLYMTDYRAKDTQNLHVYLEQTKDELDRCRSEVQVSQQTLQHMTILIKRLEDRAWEQDEKMYHIMGVHSDKHALRRAFHVFHHYCVTTKHKRKLVLTVIHRFHHKSKMAALVLAFSKWASVNHRNIITFRLIRKSVMKWSHRSTLSAFNKWRLATHFLRSEEMLTRQDHTASRQILYLMTNHTFEFYFEKWRIFVHAQKAQRKWLRGTMNRLLQRSLSMAMRKWKTVTRGSRSMTTLRRNMVMCLRYKLASAWRKWTYVCVLSRRKYKLLKSVCLACVRSKTASVNVAFRQWKTNTRTQQLFSKISDRQACWLRSVFIARGMQRVFNEWRRVTYRDVRRVGKASVGSVVESIPTAGLLYNLFNNKRHTLDDVVLEAGRALTRILPGFGVEIYIMHAPNMLRAVLPYGSLHRRSRSPSPTHYQTAGTGISTDRGETLTTTEEFLGNSYGRFGGGFDGMDFNDTYQHLSPIGRFNQPTPGEFSSGVLSVIVGRGPVGLCAKTGAYRVVRSPQSVYDQMENEPAAVSLVVLPLIYNYRVVGVLQLTSTNAMHLDEAMLNSTLHVDSSLSPAGSPSRASMQPIHMNPFHLQIHEMCIEMGIDLVASLKLSVVVTSLAHSIDLYERSAELRLQEEQREVSREQETEELVAERDKALGRVEHLERSRLRHFKQSRRLREEAILWRKRCIEVKQSLEEYMEQVEAYDSQSREVEALHRAMREATTQVFGADEGQWTNAYTSSEYIDTTEYNYAPDADTLMMRTARSGVSSNSAPSESQFIDRSRAANSTVMFTPSLPDEGVSHTNPSRGGAGRRGR